ncbi:HNH endonuclease [Rhizoctonia solani AG-3 Rhs1AP]|uniref:HNH endonuclease n=1 Tax=Rhizoctonia solani AG-3 Rhs1AP TaxID=1086054 RepID=X8J3A4_9AGAM|nr:HNH endonuclease [Rhizoctonia solani AG-3 Rhs1AP]
MANNMANNLPSDTPSPPNSGDNYTPGDAEISQGSGSSPPPKRARSDVSVASTRLTFGSRVPSESVLAAGERLCIITLSQVTPTDCCHVVRRSITCDGAKIDMLEYAWGVTGELNLDTPRNLFFLSADFHRSFDRYDWVLVPTDDDLSTATIQASTRLNYLKALPADEYQYTFVHLKGHPARIHRDKLVTNASSQAATDLYETYFPPYNTFPTLVSKIHPYFVIYEAATALKSLTPAEMKAFRGTIPNAHERTSVVSRLLICDTIANAWMQVFQSRPIPPAPTHLSAPSESRATTRSMSSRDSARRSSQPLGSKRKRSDQGRSQHPTQHSAAQEASPSTLASPDSPHTPEHQHDAIWRFVHENPDPVIHRSDIAEWAKDVSAYSVGEIHESQGSDAVKPLLVAHGEEGGNVAR